MNTNLPTEVKQVGPLCVGVRKTIKYKKFLGKNPPSPHIYLVILEKPLKRGPKYTLSCHKNQKRPLKSIKGPPVIIAIWETTKLTCIKMNY